MKKNILIFITLAAMAFCVTVCKPGGSSVERNKDGKIDVTTTIFASYDFIRNIAGDRVNLTMLLPPGAETHSFEPSPRDIITIQNSDIFIYVGGESEDWIERILDSNKTKNLNTLALMDIVEVVEEEIVEGMEAEEHEHKHGNFFTRLIHRIFHHDDDEDDEDDYDEHVWTSPKNAMLIVSEITDLLCAIDPNNASYFRQNAASYMEKLEELDAAFTELAQGAARRTIVFGDRFPFRYFADAYDLEYYAAFPGCSTETEPSAATVAFLVNKIRSEGIPVVFHVELSNERMANTISGETGAKKLLLHACHNVSKSDLDAGLGYLDFMWRNVENLRMALY